MKNVLLICLVLLSFNCMGQDKIVKVVSDKVFISFFYKSNRATRYTKNDTTYYLSKRINDSSFTLKKYQKRKLIWSRKMNAIVAPDSLVLYDKTRGQNDKSKIIKSKAKYYLGIEIP